MQRFRRLFALLFILSLFSSVVHEASHAHHYGELCEVCVLSHAPALLGNTATVSLIDPYYEPFAVAHINLSPARSILNRSRSPPLV
ncbi:MAG: hypothetical protein Q8K81_02350 [Sulfuricurvum sp.]|nr:hypothetical protein [Sulfuricurvum sp.]